MKIKSLYVKGFGTLRDYTIPELSPGITVFEGRNEAGKTTLMSFIRAILFGFAGRAKHTVYDRYEPVNGGQHGGSLTLVDESGQEYVIERAGSGKGRVTVYLPDGRQEGELYLQEMLGGISPMLFRNIFAFSLTEIQQLEFMDSDEVSGYIYSAGMGASVIQAEKKLDDRMNGLFKKNGQTPIINALLRRIKETESEIARLKNLAQGYNQMSRQCEQFTERIRTEETELDDLRQQISWLELVQKAREEAGRVRALQLELEDLPEIDTFPANGISRLEALQAQLREVELTSRTLQEKKQRLLDEKDSLSSQENVLAYQTQINRLIEQAGTYLDRRQALAENSVRLAQLREELTKRLEQLGSEWTEEKILRFDLSIPRREEVRAFRDRLRTLEMRVNALSQEMEHLKRDFDNQFTELEALPAELPASLEQKWQKLTRREAALREVRELSARMQLIANKQEHTKERINDLLAQADAMDAMQSEKNSESPRWLIVVFFLVGLVLSAIVWYLNPPAGMAAVFIVLLAVGIWFSMQQKAGSSNRHTQRVRDERARIQTKINQLKTMMDTYKHEEEELRGQAGEHARILGLPGGGQISPDMLLRLELEIAAEYKQFDSSRQLMEKRKDKEKNAHIIQQQLEEVTQLANEKNRELAAEHAAWMKWLEERGLATSLSAEGVLDMFRLVESGRDTLQQIRSLLAARTLHEQEMESFEKEIIGICSSIQTPHPPSSDVVRKLRELKKRLEQSLMDTARSAQLEGEITRILEDIRSAEAHRLAFCEEMEHLLNKGGAGEEETFRLRSAQFDRRRAIKEEIRRMDTSLLLLAGTEERKKQLEQDVFRINDAEANERLAQLAGTIRQRQEKINEWRDQVGRLRQQLISLEKEGSLAERLQDYEELLTELRDHARVWGVHAITRHLLKQARERYERERQPGVLRSASRYFEHITEGTYKTVMAPFGERRLLVERHDGERIEPGYLSRGTKEQLYLSVRFALAGEYARKCSLPIIMDDIFVNFDLPRLRTTIETLEVVAETHQILLFTCHPHVTAAFPGKHTVIRMGEPEV
ncbi:ATP-binding protein [Aneurinibacillus terranovensis]|uniref:ATP-binding protein n=1 Tax=Aneurinibacillus terranovensis TaxID=278991 RepID=UPI000416D347|nr:AAA family ATPase [Aneurinibacillus terranovensis]